MSKRDDEKGCLFIVGLILTALCVGSLYSEAAGWLVIGVGLLLMAVL